VTNKQLSIPTANLPKPNSRNPLQPVGPCAGCKAQIPSCENNEAFFTVTTPSENHTSGIQTPVVNSYTLIRDFSSVQLATRSMTCSCSCSRQLLSSFFKGPPITCVNREAAQYEPTPSFSMYKRRCSLFRILLLRILKGANFNSARASSVTGKPPLSTDARQTNSM
jgi:hypothetical protein